MEPLMQPLPLPYVRGDLIVPERVTAELDLLVARARQRQGVPDEATSHQRAAFGQGTTALFSGPPGTGKTMAAQVLARELDLDLYRIDLSGVISKYIGETEKNLRRVFDAAEEGRTILFFDEADALFGKRTEVEDPRDRYENVEVRYLLQRSEQYDGMGVLATNLRESIDEAFMRRLDIAIDFPMPSAADRQQIWQRMLSPKAVAKGIDFSAIARTYELSGGEIGKVALTAAHLAASESQAVGMSHLKRALQHELAKSGRVIDQSELRNLDAPTEE